MIGRLPRSEAFTLLISRQTIASDSSSSGPERAPSATLAIAVWYALLLLPTLAFKWRLLGLAYGEGLPATLSSAASEHPAFEWWLDAGLPFAADLVEVFVVVLVLFVLTRSVAPRRMPWLMAASAWLASLVLLANHLCYRQTQSMLTAEVLREALRWAARDPAIVASFVSPRSALLWIALALWGAWPVAFALRGWPGAMTAHTRGIGLALLAAVAAGALGASIAAGDEAAANAFARGYWTQAARAFTHRVLRSPLDSPPRTLDELRAAFDPLAFPLGIPPRPAPPSTLPADALRPRHILLVSLETAPARYYPLDRPALPTLRRMAEHALVGDHHYSTAPETTAAVYSMVSGTYPPIGPLPNRYGDFETDGLATVLSRHGYDTTYIDSYVLDWASRGDDRLVRSLGFAHAVDSQDLGESAGVSWEGTVAAERRSFDRALRSIVDASAAGRKAFVCLVTVLGHFPWGAAGGEPGGSAAGNMAEVLQTIDGLLARLLEALDAQGLGDDVIVVVTGDHGPRFQSEFTALGEPFPRAELTFRVPFLLYAPALFHRRIPIPYNTSHVDIAATLLDFCGIPRDSLLQHGENVLNPRLRDRAVFLGGGELYPVDSLRWGDRIFTRSRLTGRVFVAGSDASARADSIVEPDAAMPATLAEEISRSSLDVFEATTAVFLRRRLEPPHAPST